MDTYAQSLKDNLDAMGFPPDAVAWLLDVWRVIQFFDDVADGDAIRRDDLDAALFSVFVGFQANPFYAANANWLVPVLSAQVLKWHASDEAERHGQADARSYVWRAGFYDVVLVAAQCAFGVNRAKELAGLILGLYGESLDGYLKEFDHA